MRKFIFLDEVKKYFSVSVGLLLMCGNGFAANAAQPTEIKSIHLGERVKAISPYIMANYSFDKLLSARSFQVQLFTTSYESMIMDGKEAVVAMVFIQRGDLHENPVVFYVMRELDPEFSERLNFCTFDSLEDNEIVIYASDVCSLKQIPNTGIIAVRFEQSDNSILLNGSKEIPLN